VHNTFQQLLVSGACAPDQPKSFFVQAVIDGVRVVSECGQWVVPQSQIFESEVLYEAKRVADLGTLPSALEEFVPVFPGETPLDVASAVAAGGLTGIRAQIAAAGLFVSLSRFRAAATALQPIGADAPVREQFERLWLEFIISNRNDAGRESDRIISTMLNLAKTEAHVPDSRLLDVCSQGIVWFLKRREVSGATVHSLLEVGRRLVSGPLRSDWAGTSAWYRAVAMVPAQSGDGIRTRQYMDQARDSAERAMSRDPSPTNANLLKTYLESTMKEAMYITRDIGRFREAASQLIALDPTWSVSHAEAAEGLEVFGLFEEARQAYADAVDMGVPYVWRNAFELLRLSASLGDWDGANQALSRLVRDNAPHPALENAVAKLGTDGATRVPDDARCRLGSRLSELREGQMRHVDPLGQRPA